MTTEPEKEPPLEASGAGPLRIATALDTITPRAGGLFHSVRSLSQGLSEAGHQVTVFAVDDVDSGSVRADWAPLEIRLLRPRGPRRLGFPSGLVRELQRGSYDVVHQHGIWQAMSHSTARWRSDTPAGGALVLSPRGMLDPWGLKHGRFKKWIAHATYQRRAFSRSDCLHALNEAELRAIRSFGLRTPVAVIPNGVDLSTTESATERPAWRDEIPAGCRVALFVGRLHPKKGLPVALRALSALTPTSRHAWHLAIAGWGIASYVRELETLVSELDLTERVHFLGPLFRDDKLAALRVSDLFVLPSLSEGHPMAALEALAQRTPALLTDQCHLESASEAGASLSTEASLDGFLAGWKAIDQLDAAGLQVMGDRGRRYVEESCGWPDIVEKMGSVYRWLAGNGEMPSCVDTS